MANCYYVKSEDIPRNYDEKGFAMSELLPGTYAGGITNYKCFLRKGCSVSPKLYSDQTVILFFGKGEGYITTPGDVYRVTEVAFFAPDFAKTPYTIFAVEDMEFVLSMVELNEWDKKLISETHVRLPFFTLLSDAIVYDQDCKGPDATSWTILSAKHLGRILVGAVRAIGEGTVEKGHPKVEQWNYCLGDSDFTMLVEGEAPILHKAGDWSYVKAGYDHTLSADPGKQVFYIWFEHFVRPKDFCLAMAPGDTFDGTW